MIRYSLECHKSHTFEVWFKNSADFDRQAKRKLVTCPECGSAKVTKALMAPSVATGRSKSKEVAVANTEATADARKKQEILALMRKLRTEVERNAEFVGPRFADEARKMHYEETEKRGIYGEATLDEARDLHEEGIEFYPLPKLPEDQN